MNTNYSGPGKTGPHDRSGDELSTSEALFWFLGMALLLFISG